MKKIITSRHFEASEQLKDFANDHLQKLVTVFNRITSCYLVVNIQTLTFLNQQNLLYTFHKSLTAKSAKATYEKAIHDVVENMKRQLKRYKEKKLHY